MFNKNLQITTLLRRKDVIYAVLIIILMSISPVSSAAITQDNMEATDLAIEEQQHYYTFDNDQIVIFYDAEDILTNSTGLAIYKSISLMTPNVVAVPVTKLSDIYDVMINTPYMSAIYVFQSTYEGMKIHRNNRFYSWEEVGELLAIAPLTHHILGMGNSYQLLNEIPVSMQKYVHGSNEELVDANEMFVYSLWELSNILENSDDPRKNKLGYDIKMASMQYFADNFNNLVSSSVEPSAPMGKEAPETVKARVDKFYNEHPAKVTKQGKNGYIVDPVTKRFTDPKTGEIVTDGYGMDIFPKESSMASDFILDLLPIDSGLRGPIGGILDSLLDYLFKEIGGAIGLDESTVKKIVDALTAIPDLVGAVSNPSGSSIKGFVDKLKPMLPIPKNMYKYVDLLIDGLFVLRGSADDIKNFITSAIGMVIPDMTVGGFKLQDIVSTVFDLGDDIFEKIKSGGNVMDIILSALNENMVASLISTLINGTDFSMDTNQVKKTVKSLISGANLLINTISTGNIKDLVFKYGPDLLNTLFDTLGVSNSSISMIMEGIGIVMYASGMMGGGLDNIQDLLESMITKVTTVTNTTKIYNAAKKIVKSIGQIVEGTTFTNLNTLTANVTSALTDLNVDANIVKGIQDVSAIVVALSKKDFSISGVTSLTGMVANLLKGLGVSSVDKINSVKTIIDGLFGVFMYIKDVPNFKKVVGDVMSGGDITKQVTKLFKEIINLVKPNTFTSQLNIDYIETEEITTDLTLNKIIETGSEVVGMILKLVGGMKDNSFQSIMMTILQGGSFLITKFTGTDVSGYVELFKGLFGQILGITDKVPSASELTNLVSAVLPSGVISKSTLNTIFTVLLGVQDVFQNGFQSIFAKLTEFLMGKVTELIGSLSGELGGILGKNTWDLVDMDIPIGIGSFSLFTINIKIGLEPHIEFDTEALTKMILDLVFKGINFFNPSDGGAGGTLSPDGMTPGDILRKALSFFSISPLLVASFELKDFGSGSSGFLTFMLESMGVELSISGYGFFKLLLFSFKNGAFSFDSFFKIMEWGFGFSITISRTFTLLDFITGGVGGGLNSIGKYIGLDAISITIYFTLAFDIIKRAATATQPETGSMTISLTIGFTVSLGIDIFIAVLKLTGTLEITLTLLQDLVSPTPLRVFISIVLIITVTIGFLFWDWDFDFRWSPDGFEPPLGYELTSPNPEDAVKKGALGGDTDGDGLSDAYEDQTPGLDKTKADTDGDGLSDKYETQTLETDPSSKDTDKDGLDDNIEMDIKTNPLQPDSDFDGLTDYEESVIYGTNPLTQDTDFDGLTDYYEINHVWNITGITPSVSGIMIGGKSYDDRTDPLNPDTDADGLIDGEEGSRGIYYGPELYDYCLNAKTEADIAACKASPTGEEDILGYAPDDPLFFNDGYTHPLDNDTDDDSYWQLYDGSKAPMDADRLFLMDMSDYVEIKGISVIFIDTDTGEPEPAKIIRTNPTNPDSDGDTGITSQQRDEPPFGFFINSDGYELSRDPPTDPLDGDTDDDGLIDGLEGMLRPDSNHTWGLNPDTDGDGLGDLQEVQLGTDGRSVDTDLDGVSDGDEFFIYGTNPFLSDTDSDGLSDFEELFIYHSSPFLRDTDGDGLLDFDEVWKFFSKPADEDSDNDFLTDYEEIMIFYTDPFNADTDGDGLLDGEEIEGFEIQVWNDTEYIPVWVKTDPTKWDTDNDSITALDQNGEMSQPMSDLDEYLLGLDPTRTDTDMDGIRDGWEVYLGSGKIPWMEPIALNATHPDTDGDGMADGVELQVVNSTMLIYPYVAFTLNQPYNSRPDMLDTDDDGLNDTKEVFELYSRADKNDTDGDSLSDYEEYVIYKTDLHSNDTDGDGLSDYDEIFGFNATDYGYAFNTIFFTHPNKTDSDGDLLPDGAEILYYVSDPTNPDENNNEILDGMEIDEDGDGLYAGEEYFVYNTVGSPDAEGIAGGDTNPDSDGDGLFDGLEVYETLSYPNDWDSDNDNYSDGLEWYCGTDLLDNTTTEAEIKACFSGLVRIAVLSPVQKTYKTNSIPVYVYDSTSTMTSMNYRYREISENETSWSPLKNIDETTKPDYWKGEYLSLPIVNATYELEVIASNATESFTRRVIFSVDMFAGGVKILSPISGQKYSFNEFQDPKLPIEVQTELDYNATWFRIYYAANNSLLTTNNISLTYETGRSTYYLSEFNFPKARGVTEYAIEVFSMKTNGEIILISTLFSIKSPTVIENIAIIAAPVLGVPLAVFGLRRIVSKRTGGGFKNPFKKNN